MEDWMAIARKWKERWISFCNLQVLQKVTVEEDEQIMNVQGMSSTEGWTLQITSQLYDLKNCFLSQNEDRVGKVLKFLSLFGFLWRKKQGKKGYAT